MQWGKILGKRVIGCKDRLGENLQSNQLGFFGKGSRAYGYGESSDQAAHILYKIILLIYALEWKSSGWIQTSKRSKTRGSTLLLPIYALYRNTWTPDSKAEGNGKE